MIFTQWNPLSVSRFILGGNPFSGFSHQGPDRDLEMRQFFTTSQIKTTFRDAERLGVNTLVARADQHILRVLFEYYQEGGDIQLLAQTCPEYATLGHSVLRAASYEARGCHIHGGVMDFLFAQRRLDEVKPVIEQIHEKGMLAGIAGHNPDVFVWAEEAALPVDYYMCSYYNPDRRETRAEHKPGVKEEYSDNDRQNMVSTIMHLSKPVIHYKILAAGRNNPQQAIHFAIKHMRTNDAICVGVFPKPNPTMLSDDVAYFLSGMKQLNPTMPTEALQSDRQ